MGGLKPGYQTTEFLVVVLTNVGLILAGSADWLPPRARRGYLDSRLRDCSRPGEAQPSEGRGNPAAELSGGGNPAAELSGEPFPTFVHALNAIEKRDPRQARNLENSLDFAYARIDEDGGTYYRAVIEMILSAGSL